MSAVIEAVVNVVEDVVEAVGDAVETVVETVETTIKAVAENPEILIIAVVAPQVLPVIGVPAIAVQPVTAALISASQGGDIEDIGKAALTAYVAPQVAGRVGGAVAAATEGSSLQNALSSAAGSAAGAATSAAITGGDIGTAALTGGAAGAGASLGREIANAVEYGTTPFSEQSEMLRAQETMTTPTGVVTGSLNRFNDLAADIGSAVGRAAVTGDLNLESAISGAASRELSDRLRDAFASSPGAPETQKATEIIAAEMDNNPGFQEQLQLAQIANGDVPLSVDQQIDALAEAIARQEFDAAATGEDVAALPAVALPIAVNAAARAAQAATPAVVQRIAQFAANDPRFAQVLVTNNYVQRLLAASGITVTVVGSVAGPGMAVGPAPHIRVEPIVRENESPAEVARLNRYAAEISRTLPNPEPGNIQRLENTARTSDLTSRQSELQNLQRQGFPVQQELQRVETQLQQVTQPSIPSIGDFPTGEPEVEIPQPGTLPQPTRTPQIDIPGMPPVRTPTRTPSAPPSRETRPGETPDRRIGDFPTEVPLPGPTPAPSTTPSPGTDVAPATEPATRTQPSTRTQPEPSTRTTPTPTRTPPTGPVRPTGPRVGPDVDVEREPVTIEDLFTDEDILELIREGLGEDFIEETAIEETPIDATDITEGVTEGDVGPMIDLRGGGPQTTKTPYRTTVSSRAVGTGPGAITGRKEPMFGGDPGAQQDVWNVRSLRLRKALGL